LVRWRSKWHCWNTLPWLKRSSFIVTLWKW
jgi:hypothetical protein